MFDNRENQIGFKVGRFALQNGSKTFQTCAGINVFIGQRSVSAVVMLVILGKYQVPDFKESVAVAARFAVRFAAAAFFTHVDVDFAVRSARAAAGFPEVFFKAHNAFIGHAHNIMPDFISFVVVRVNGYPKFIGRQFQLFGQKLPAPGDNFLFEIIAEGKIAQHFKISMVARSAAYIFNIAGAHAFLASGDTRRRRFHLAGKKRFKRRHACAD